MLAERVAKVHAQLGRGVMTARSRRAMSETTAEFEKGLREVSAAAVTPDQRENCRLLRLLWDEYRVAAAQAPTPEGARRLGERAEEVAWVAAKGARLMNASVSHGIELMMAAGSARAAAERLGKLHLQRGWSLPANAAPREVKRAEGEILLALAQLKSDAEANEEISMQLRMAEDQLAFLRQAVDRLMRGVDRPLQLEHIAKSADYIAETMDRVAKAYEN